jgi:putative SOS response-associated peptidase YedK
MCGRFAIETPELIPTRFQVRNAPPPLLRNTDVRPTQQVPAIGMDRELELMSWWLVPAWSRDGRPDSKYPMFNARAEGIQTKRAFQGPLLRSRCLIPANAFFEWQGAKGQKTKYRIARRDGDLFAFAGLFETWRSLAGNELKSCTIITTTPNQVMASIHTRMPVILLPEDEEAWLSPDLAEPEQVLPLLRPYPDGLLEARPA